MYATVTTDSRDEQASRRVSELEAAGARLRPLLARLADWVDALGVDALAGGQRARSREHAGPLLRLAARAAHQMSEAEEGLYAELATTGSAAWARLHGDVTSQLDAPVALPDGRTERLPMPAVRGLATAPRPGRPPGRVRRRGGGVADGRRAVRGGDERDQGRGQHRQPAPALGRRPLDASLFANAVSRPTFDAMQAAVDDALPDFRRWLRAKARLHGHAGALPWWDLVAPLPVGAARRVVGRRRRRSSATRSAATTPRSAGSSTAPSTSRWIDAAPRDGKRGGAFCMSFAGDRSLVLLNWTGSVDSAQTTAHELGHAYHNTTLAARTPLQRRLPMALAETASIFCETLVVDAGLRHADGRRPPGPARRRPPGRRPRSSSTSTAASCSRPRCSPAGSAARSASPSSTS